MERKFLFVLLVGVVALTATLITQWLISAFELKSIASSPTPSPTTTIDSTSPLLDEVIQTTEDRFYLPEKLEQSKELTQILIRAYLESLGDPYTRYNTPEEYQSFSNDLNGDYEGIGAYIEKRGDYVIANPIKGSPAEAAGMLSGDKILNIDGEDAKDFEIGDASSRLRGPKGTQVTVEVAHPDGRWESITITRDQIHIGSVTYSLIEPDIAKISISRFGSDTAQDVKNALRDLERAGEAPLSGIILDLRGNGGGYLQSAEEIASLFVERGQLTLIERDRSGQKDHWSRGNDRKNLPIAVLIDEGTASASEILSGAIRDNDMGILIGRNSFGKGVIQSTYNLSDGSALIITTAEYLTPDEHHVQGIGLAPATPKFYVDSWRDAVVEISDEFAGFNEVLNTVGLSKPESDEDEKSASEIALREIGVKMTELGSLARDDDYEGAKQLLKEIRLLFSEDPIQLLDATGIQFDEREGVLFEYLLSSFSHQLQEPFDKLEQRLENNYITVALQWLRSPEISGKLCPCVGSFNQTIVGDADSK